MNLAVVTLGMGFAVQQMIFSNEYFTGDFGSVTEIGRIHVFGWDVNSAAHPERYFVVCLGIFVLSSLMVANLRRSGTGLRLIAVRNNERAAASLGISVFGAKLYAFAVGAAIAVVRRDPPRVQGHHRRLRPLPGVRVDQPGRQRGGRRHRLGARRACSASTLGARAGSARSSSTGSTSGPGSSRSAACSLIVTIMLNPNGIASVVLHDERGIGRLRLRLRRKPRREQLSDEPVGPVSPATLEVHDLTVRFGAVVAVDDVSFRVEPGEVVGLIGPNGAGKTTIVDAVTGFVRSNRGEVSLAGVPMRGRAWGPARRARAGLRRTFQSLELFEDISVGENLHAGAAEHTRLSGAP